MAINLDQYVGTLPYASELFGVYQPLLGWRSKRKLSRAAKDQSMVAEALVHAMTADYRYHQAVGADKAPKGPDTVLPPMVASWLDEAVAVQLRTALTAFSGRNGRLPAGSEWQEVVRTMQLDKVVRAGAASLEKSGRDVGDGAVRIFDKTTMAPDRLRALGATAIPGTSLVVARSAKASADGPHQSNAPEGVNTALQAGTLTFLSHAAPGALSSLVDIGLAADSLRNWVDPLSQFDPDTQDGVLSPIGLIHIFRQYFFELESFLGPSVGHVWVSPGGSLEVFETHTRKTIEERMFSSSTTSMTKTEQETALEDELSTKIAKENTSSLSVGVSASASTNFGVFQASASANFGLNSSRKVSQESAHTQTRKQSEKISSELRRDFKTTFRTSVEVQDTSSRRYILKNDTDKIVNYEFRRKMRQVGVQVQHVGTRLCWQVYVDEPGARLGVSELVHIAQRGDLTGQIQPPEAPPSLEPTEQEFDALFPYMGDLGFMDATYANGASDVTSSTIDYSKEYDVIPPTTGYKLANVEFRDVTGSDPDMEAPFVDPRFDWTDTTIKIVLPKVNFCGNSSLRFVLNLTFTPTASYLAEITAAHDAAVATYTEATARASHEEYVRGVRERIKLASGIVKRSEDDLRTEERSAVFERLIRQLIRGAGDETPHVAVELIRAIFDVDQMLYFVSESWWRPRARVRQQLDSGKEPLTMDDRIGWGGRRAKRRANYFVTEDSQPAPLGASLGWLLQLDGDDHRNAFLNSNFVKAVIPIRPGKERAAMEWLERAHVEGADGLDLPYRGNESEYHGRTTREVLFAMAAQLRDENADVANVLASETVFEKGFDPLEGGFVADGHPYEVFDQWIEVLPTEQVVATEYPKVTA